MYTQGACKLVKAGYLVVVGKHHEHHGRGDGDSLEFTVKVERKERERNICKKHTRIIQCEKQ